MHHALQVSQHTGEFRLKNIVYNYSHYVNVVMASKYSPSTYQVIAPSPPYSPIQDKTPQRSCYPERNSTQGGGDTIMCPREAFRSRRESCLPLLMPVFALLHREPAQGGLSDVPLVVSGEYKLFVNRIYMILWTCWRCSRLLELLA